MTSFPSNPQTTDSIQPAEKRERMSERDRLILENLPLVRAIAVRVSESLPVHVDVDDLAHAGIMGLMDAAAKYDSTKQVTFRAYAKHRIKGAILDSLREMDWASRDLRRRHKQLEAITRELSAAMERNPTEAEIAEKMGMDIERWRQVAIELRMMGLLSASTRAPEDENQSTPEFPAGDELNPDVIAKQRQLRSFLSEAMKMLPDRYQTVIGLYYVGGKTMREIGDRMGINESRVSQIHRAALDRMAVSLQSAGIHSSECVF
jgi:RNA polymerase sigma factor for flagellar operon FliA